MPEIDLKLPDTRQYSKLATRGIADFIVEAVTPIEIKGPPALLSRNLMSPYVWPSWNGTLGILLRAVPPQKPWPDTGQIWAGVSRDGTRFDMDETPVLVGGVGEDDAGGVEDPSVHVRPDGGYLVYYTGLHADRRHGRLLMAQGHTLDKLKKVGPALPKAVHGSTKEAALYQAKQGAWRLFFEYADEGASRIGAADCYSAAGPWQIGKPPFGPRPENWDSWHLSTGPVVADEDDNPVMFYNGATEDGRWRIGWVIYNRSGTEVVDRCLQPLLIPPPPKDRSATDIAFAASAFQRAGRIWLYYTLEDRRVMRATVRRIPGFKSIDCGAGHEGDKT